MPNVTSYIVKLSRIGLMIWLGICLHTQAFYAQSFISNGDFETMTLCPDTTSMLVLAEGWFEANLANPDYFNACDIEGVVGVPENFIGSESAHSGSGYAGIYVAENDGMIGVVGINWMFQPTLDLQDNVDKLNIMSVKGIGKKEYVYPSQDNLAKGIYPLARDLYIINCQGYSGLGMGFASFVAGERGQRIILKSGLVPENFPSRKIVTRPNIVNIKN